MLARSVTVTAIVLFAVSCAHSPERQIARGRSALQLIGHGVVRGVILDRSTLGPVANAVVTVAGSRARATTAADGGFELVGVPIGPQQLRFRVAGYNDTDVAGVIVSEFRSTCTFALASTTAPMRVAGAGNWPDGITFELRGDSIAFFNSNAPMPSDSQPDRREVIQIRNPLGLPPINLPFANSASSEIVLPETASQRFGSRAQGGALMVTMVAQTPCEK